MRFLYDVIYSSVVTCLNYHTLAVFGQPSWQRSVVTLIIVHHIGLRNKISVTNKY